MKYILFIFLGLSSAAQGQIDQITIAIANTGTLSFDQDVQFQRFVELNEKATDEELVSLMNHNSPAVRGYAFWGLAKRNYSELRSIFINHIDDTEKVFQKNGCMKGDESVISFMRQVVTPYMYDPDCKKLDDNTRALVKVSY